MTVVLLSTNLLTVLKDCFKIMKKIAYLLMYVGLCSSVYCGKECDRRCNECEKNCDNRHQKTEDATEMDSDSIVKINQYIKSIEEISEESSISDDSLYNDIKTYQNEEAQQ